MIYEYKKLGIRVIANSKEEAIENILKAPKYKITAMSFSKERLEREIVDQTPNIITWWCLCWYLKNIENKNGLLHHEKVKLKGLLKKLNSRKFKGKDSLKVKTKLLEVYWIDECEFNKNIVAVTSEFESKFDEEGIKKNNKVFRKVAKEFGKETTKLIEIVTKGSVSSIEKYVDTRFQE